MGTAGILRPDEVIFYHPLDADFKEHTASEVWSGTAASVPGKIGQGNSAVTSSDIGFGALSTIVAGTADWENDPVNVTALSATSVVATYGKISGDDSGRAKAGVVSGTAVTWGAETTYRPGANAVGTALQGRLCSLDATHVLVSYGKSAGDGYGGFVKVGTVSGLDLTWGTEHQFTSDALVGEMMIEAVDSTRAVVLYRGASGHAKATVCMVSGADVTSGSQSTYSTVAGHSATETLALTALDSDKVLAGACWSDDFRVGTLSGLDLTWGAAHTFAMDTWNRITLAALDSTTAVLTRYIGGCEARVVKVSGTDITVGSSVMLNGAARGANVSRLSATTCAMSYRANGAGRAVIGTVSGMDITLGTFATWNTETMLRPHIATLNSTSFITVSHEYQSGAETGSARAAVGTLDASAGLSGTTGLYPSAIGATRVVLAMWAENLTGGSSTVTIERGYSVALTATSVSLGGTTAVWSDAGISTLMSTMNDGGDHMLVLDFENTGGTSWNLRTSVDGAGFTDQGAQDSGTQAVTTADTAPEIAIEDGAGADQWVDELVMWAGDKTTFDLFTTEELANLNDLADTFGETMDKYEENYGAPICWQATATMPDGTVWRDSGSGPCPAVIRVPRGAADIVVTDEGRVVSPRIQEG